jgi:hypothetical protein
MVDYRLSQEPTKVTPPLPPRPYTDAQLQWVEQQLKQMSFKGNIEEVSNDPVVNSVIEALQVYDPKKYSELEILFNTAKIIRQENAKPRRQVQPITQPGVHDKFYNE